MDILHLNSPWKGKSMQVGRDSAGRNPFIGWEANLTSEYLEYTTARIANMSTGGAYLITEADYEPGSIVTLWVKSSQLSFFVTAKVNKNDSIGIAVSFLDLRESDRRAISVIITRFLSKRKVKN
jgi:hypothetical protein